MTQKVQKCCPRCGFDKVLFIKAAENNFYSEDIEGCLRPGCGAIWEAFNPDDLLDFDDPLSPFREKCTNCAFRAGSPEQRDAEGWSELIKNLKEGGLHGGFFCHKGVPIAPESEHGFEYPHKDGKPERSKLRPCRGWLDMMAVQIKKEIEAGKYD